MGVSWVLSESTGIRRSEAKARIAAAISAARRSAGKAGTPRTRNSSTPSTVTGAMGCMVDSADGGAGWTDDVSCAAATLHDSAAARMLSDNRRLPDKSTTRAGFGAHRRFASIGYAPVSLR